MPSGTTITDNTRYYKQEIQVCYQLYKNFYNDMHILIA